MSGDSQWETQQAVAAKLAATAAVSAFIGARIYDGVPTEPLYPFIVFGQTTSEDFSSRDVNGISQLLTLHIFSNYRGDKEIKQIMAAISAALNRTAYAISGHILVLSQFVRSDTARNNDGLIREGIVQYQIMTQEVAP